jgi:septum formation protein
MPPLLHLVSASPRRRELLGRLGIPLAVSPVDADESFVPDRDPELQAGEIARRKMDLFLASPEGQRAGWALSADTFIEQDGLLMGKPADRSEAGVHLRALSGRSHRVLTGVTIHRLSGRRTETAVSATTVTFRPLGSRDIEWYLDTGEWLDAAGSYKIQGAGEALIFSINGPYSNVMGLPLNLVYEMLLALDYPW